MLTGNGAHLYFAHPGGPIPNSVNRIGPGIDIRSDGGYVLAPPSLHHTNHRYRWLQPADQQLQAAPHWLLTRCQPPTPRTVSEPIVLRDSLHAWALAAMHGETDRVRNAVAGTRNTTLSTAAFRLGQLCATGHLDPTHVTAQLLDAAHHAGLTPNEAQRTITSGLNAGHHHPRQHLPTH